MCGRFTSSSPGQIVAETFRLSETPELAPRYNIAPTQDVAAIRDAEGTRELVALRWGLIPSWSKDPSIGNRLINARAETLGEKPAFRSAFRSRRCLIVADGFFEWAREGKGKQPYLIRYRDGRPFGFAGLWERWRDPDGGEVESCTIVTTEPNALVAPIHDRMPVIVPPAGHARWLDPAGSDPEALAALLRPADCDGMVAFAVATAVNNPANDSPECVRPLR